MILTMPFEGRFDIRTLEPAMFNRYTTFKVSSFTRHEGRRNFSRWRAFTSIVKVMISQKLCKIEMLLLHTI